MRLLRLWHRLPREAAETPNLAVTKARLDGTLRCPCPWQHTGSRAFDVPPSPNHCVSVSFLQEHLRAGSVEEHRGAWSKPQLNHQPPADLHGACFVSTSYQQSLERGTLPLVKPEELKLE